MAEVILRHGDREYRVEVNSGTVLVDGAAVEVPERAIAVANGETRWVFMDGEVWEFDVQSPERTRKRAAHHGTLTSPMPATVRKIAVAPGAAVKKGDTLLVLEAMKMELPVRAPSDGVVASISCREGELVQPGVALVEME
jgi:acetyl-CoA/propionyl-CoA carboxylase biotin carboxyl carrier protein